MSVTLKRLDAVGLSEALPYPSRDANKYTRGKLTVVGGCEEYPGSACLASKAALFAGAGYVECACSAPAVPLVRSFAPSLVVRPWEGASAATLGLDSVDGRHPKAALVGSGMFADGGFQATLVSALIQDCAAPLVLDGGALRIVAEADLCEPMLSRLEKGRVTAFTPHGGEAAALAHAVNLDVPEPDAPWEKMAAYAQALAKSYGASVLLKGPVSFIASCDSEVVHLMDQGTPALAKAGTGDVLAGIVGAYLAQAMDAPLACVLAATVHAEAGRAAAQTQGVISVTAEDVLDAVPQALQSL